jgi:hypothetical protein
MRLEQKRSGIHVTYDFGETALDYTLIDRSGQFQCIVQYESIDLKNYHTFRAPSDIIFTAVLLLAGAIFIALAMLSLEREVQSFAGISGSAFISVAVGQACRRGVKQTLFKAGQRQIKVLDGKNHHAIVNEIKRRSKERIRTLYANVDLSNDPNKEAQKFRWLRENEIIDEHEYNAALSRIAAAQAASVQKVSEVSLLN